MMKKNDFFPSVKDCLLMTDLPEYEYISSLAERASNVLENEITSYRPVDINGNPGSLLELNDLPVVIIPDLHARPKFLLDILNYELPSFFCDENEIEKNITIEEALSKEIINVICVGDAIHTELTSDRWKFIDKEFQENFHTGLFIKTEMKLCLSTLCAIMTLKCKYPSNFHFLKGNHENILNETCGGDFAFCKYADEGQMVKTFISEYYGDDVLYLISCWEKGLPLVAYGKNYIVSHGEPAEEFSRQQLIDARYDSDVVSGLIWTRNGQVKKNTVEGIMKNLLAEEDIANSYYFAGHRPVYNKYAVRQNGKFIQIHNPRAENIVLLSKNRKFDFEKDIVGVEK